MASRVTQWFRWLESDTESLLQNNDLKQFSICFSFNFTTTLSLTMLTCTKISKFIASANNKVIEMHKSLNGRSKYSNECVVALS